MGATPKYASLHALEASRRSSAILVLLLLVNIGLIIFSHLGVGAQIMSNVIVPASSRQRERQMQSVDLPRRALQAACTPQEQTTYDSLGGVGSDAANLTGLDTLIQNCAAGCGFVTISDPSCVTACMEGADVGAGATPFSNACASCVGDFGICLGSECLSDCAQVLNSVLEQKCVDCYLSQCGPAYFGCTGFTASAGLSSLAPVVSGSTYYAVGGTGDVSFVSTIELMFENGLHLMGILLLLASGVKPYAECVALTVLWFVPLPARPRGQILRWINRFSRWTFLDMLVVVVLASAVDIRAVSGSVHLVIETRAAIYTFVVMSVLLTPIGEWMSHRAIVLSGHENKGIDPANLGCCGFPLSKALDGLLQREARKGERSLSPLLCLFASASLALSGAAIFVPYAVTWSIADNTVTPPSIESFPETLATLGIQVAAPVSGASPAGGVFLAIVYYLIVVVIPLTTALAMLLVAVLPPKLRAYRHSLRYAQALNPFVCLDVPLNRLTQCALSHLHASSGRTDPCSMCATGDLRRHHRRRLRV